MKVLLINPGIKKETQPPIFNSLVFSSLPLGLAYVAAYLREKNKLDLKIIDEVVTPLSDDNLSKELDNNETATVVGISCLTPTYSRAIELARKIKLMKPGISVVFGGVHPTAIPEESLQTGVVDIVVRNEGEVTMSEVCETLKNREDLSKVKGISFIKNGVIYHNPAREYANLEILPKIPYDLFEHNAKRYSDFGVILTSRGCPFDCIFCSNRIITGKRYRTFGLDYAIDHVETLVRKYKQKSINFIDDNILGDKKRFFVLTNAIIEKGLHKEAFFTAQFRGEDMTEEILEQMKKSNFRLLGCGFETSSERLMALLNKRELVSEIIRGVKLAGSRGFLISATLILGIPTETRIERRKTMRLARDLPIDGARFNIAIPYPGTKLFEIAKKENRLQVGKEWKNFNVQYYLFGNDIPYFPASTTKYSLIFDTMWANIRFYLRPKILLTILFKTDLTGGGVLSFQNKKKALKTYISLFKMFVFVLRRFLYVGAMAILEKRPRTYK